MPVNNLVYALASPSRVADTSWIKPGMAAWEWWNDWGLRGVPFKAGINNETYRYFIDFAADNGIEYVVLDEGWYVPKSGDMLTTIPEIDLPALVGVCRQEGCGAMALDCLQCARHTVGGGVQEIQRPRHKGV